MWKWFYWFYIVFTIIGQHYITQNVSSCTTIETDQESIITNRQHYDLELITEIYLFTATSLSLLIVTSNSVCYNFYLIGIISFICFKNVLWFSRNKHHQKKFNELANNLFSENCVNPSTRRQLFTMFLSIIFECYLIFHIISQSWYMNNQKHLIRLEY